MYQIITGPMIWLSLSVFVVGMLVRVVLYIRGLNWQLDRVAYGAHLPIGLKGAVRSIIFWLLPFGTNSWRKQPFMTVIFFIFHLGAVLVPLFLLAHNMILKDILGFSSPLTLNIGAADFLSWAVILCAILIIFRRISLPEVRIMTTAYDYFILFLAVDRKSVVVDDPFWLAIHILCGELFLILAPFTKLSHIVLFFMSRAQLGMDFGIKRGGMKGTNMNW